MTLLLKAPDSRLDYGVDWGAEYLSDDTLASSNWSVTPDEPGGLTVAASEAGLTASTVTVEGGIAGRVYRLANGITTVRGREDSRSIMVRVEKR